MPIFEYYCENCKIKKEKLILSNDEENTKCDECGLEMKKIMSSSSFNLKGQDYYKSGFSSNKSIPGITELEDSSDDDKYNEDVVIP